MRYTRRQIVRAGIGAGLFAGVGCKAFNGVAMAAEDAPQAPDARDGRIFQRNVPLKTPRKKEPRGGGPLDAVEVNCWVPNGVASLRGVLVNPYYTALVGREDYQQLARHLGFAVIGANYFGVRNDDYDTLIEALDGFATDAGHAELVHAPFCFNSFSAGCGMLMKMAALYPQRTIACCPVGLEVGPRDEATQSIPTITVFGERDNRQFAQLSAKLPEQRREGALWSIAPQWGQQHEYHYANDLVWPWWEHAIRSRLGEQQSSDGPPSLKAMDEADGWLGDAPTKKGVVPQIAPFSDYAGDKTNACWLPNALLARAWQAFLADVGEVKLAVPDSLVIHRHASLDIAIEKAPQDARKIELFNGDVKLDEAAGERRSLTIKNLPVGVTAIYARVTRSDASVASSRVIRKIVV
ncbi:MAG: hypothetical protein GC159_03260 [Phycisphaera sp.]|nr:hypothetical protein [Phycisphaera sp.]